MLEGAKEEVFLTGSLKLVGYQLRSTSGLKDRIGKKSTILLWLGRSMFLFVPISPNPLLSYPLHPLHPPIYPLTYTLHPHYYMVL